MVRRVLCEMNPYRLLRPHRISIVCSDRRNPMGNHSFRVLLFTYKRPGNERPKIFLLIPDKDDGANGRFCECQACLFPGSISTHRGEVLPQ